MQFRGFCSLSHRDKRELKEWKKMVEKQLTEKNNAINDLRDVLRVQTKQNKDIRRENQELLQAIHQIEKQLQAKYKEDERDERFEISENRTRVLQRRVSILTSTLRETNKRMDEMASSLTTKKHQGEQSSDLIHSTIRELQEFTQKVSGVEKNLEALECKFLKIEQQLNREMNVEKQALLKSLLQEIYELEDEKEGLIKFTEEALGISHEDKRIQLNERLNSTLGEMRLQGGNNQMTSCL